MSDMDTLKQATVDIGFYLAEQMGEEAFLVINAAYKAIYKAGIEKGIQIATGIAPPAA